MTNPLRPVWPGAPLAIPANVFNAFVASARDLRRRGSVQGIARRSDAVPAGLVLVRNDTGAACDRFAPVGLSGPIILPADNEAAFAEHVAVSGVAPSESAHAGAFAVLQEPLPVGAVGAGLVAGATAVRLYVEDEEVCAQAEVADAHTGGLTAVETGSTAVLWREGGTGWQWAIVRLANSAPAMTRIKADGAATWLDGDIIVAVAGPASIDQDDGTNTITITVDALPTTSLKIASAGTWLSGPITLAADGAASLAQDDGTKTITISATDTVTRLKASGAAAWLVGDITVAGTGLASISQDAQSNIITVDVPQTLCDSAGQAAVLSKDLSASAGSAEAAARCDQRHPSRVPVVEGAIPTGTVSGDIWLRNPA